jgi:hypothetical protein
MRSRTPPSPPPRPDDRPIARHAAARSFAPPPTSSRLTPPRPPSRTSPVSAGSPDVYYHFGGKESCSTRPSSPASGLQYMVDSVQQADKLDEDVLRGDLRGLGLGGPIRSRPASSRCTWARPAVTSSLRGLAGATPSGLRLPRRRPAHSRERAREQYRAAARSTSCAAAHLPDRLARRLAGWLPVAKVEVPWWTSSCDHGGCTARGRRPTARSSAGAPVGP